MVFIFDVQNFIILTMFNIVEILKIGTPKPFYFLSSDFSKYVET